MFRAGRSIIRATTARRSYNTTLKVSMSLHDFSLNTLASESVKLDKYKGKVVLLENVATL